MREYSPWIKAEVTVAGSQDQSARAAFRILAGYIFGDNAPSEKIGMTAPVGQQPAAGEKIGMTAPVGQEPQAAGSGQWVVWFMMPSRYTLQTLPEPADDRIRLREQPAHRAAVLAFRGKIREGTFDQRAAELREALVAAGLEAGAGEPTYAQYSPPMLPGFLRRNEVIVRLAGPQ
ncbi:MAG: hypothetical protein ACI8S6_003909 [Myxococcota bacterium]